MVFTMKIETKQVYISDDGLTFSTAAECEAHEAEQLKRKQALVNLRVWSVSHGFDETEGRGYFAQTLIITDATQPVLIQWCLDKFGPPLDAWYGGGFYEKWMLYKTDKNVDWAISQRGKIPYSNHSKIELAVVSKSDWTWAKLPKSEHPWPRKNNNGRY
jgi:hypothetical protein